MTVQDRTKEFFSAIEAIQQRGTGAMQAAQLMNRLTTVDRRSPTAPLLRPESAKSEFTKMAASVARDISVVSGRLEKLTRLANKKSLFNDKPAEINELTFLIKEDISKISSDIKSLENYLRNGPGGNTGNKQLNEHSQNIILSLQSKLANTSFAFKDVLEIRSNNLKEQQARREELSYAPTRSNPNSLVVHSAESALYQPSASVESHISINMPYPQQQQQLVPAQDLSYMDSRAEAIEGIERTIHDLAGLFQQLTTMINSHDDLVRRIDYNVDEVNINVENAQQQLMRYMSSISSNRWLMIRIFMIVIIFFLLFVFFFA